ncbi:hypothetical protein [Desulfitobacterium metallireducens]|uniref:Membrane protein n=1 Tax=Desulfitobacterium metallireducens DSM 15288 TaxID=871968 RepID=W0ED57_9FIRM|nr:hypothetical protein [Desulfitobacterium metallireducens]AHF07468.1 membrane protein [Desulfitobacterium metallireducens DSM 15288]
MTFWQLVALEGLLLLAAGMTIIAGIRGIIGASLILTSLIGLFKQEEFWLWELSLLAGVSGAVILLLFFSRKAGKSELITGLAGGMVSLVVFGAFLTPFIALMLWAMVMGTGLVPHLRRKQVFWGIAPVLWRTFLGLTWIVLGNILI